MRIYDYVQNEDFAVMMKALFYRARTMNSGKLATKAATDDQDFATAAEISYIINGILYIKAITATIDNSATTAGAAATAGTGVQDAGTYAAYLLVIDAAGDFDVLKGDDAATAALALKALPALPANKAPVGITVVTNTTNPFIFGTTKASAAGVTFTHYNISEIPYGYGESSIYKDAIGA